MFNCCQEMSDESIRCVAENIVVTHIEHGALLWQVISPVKLNHVCFLASDVLSPYGPRCSVPRLLGTSCGFVASLARRILWRLGRMGQTLSEPITAKETACVENGRFKVGSSSMQGWRVTMEDAHTHILSLPDDPSTAFFGVYDGHGGEFS